jgi:hypothetical protein
MKFKRWAVALTSAVAVAPALAGFSLGTPLGGVLGVRLPVDLGTALPVGLGGVAAVGAISLILGVQLLKRRNK